MKPIFFYIYARPALKSGINNQGYQIANDRYIPLFPIAGRKKGKQEENMLTAVSYTEI